MWSVSVFYIDPVSQGDTWRRVLVSCVDPVRLGCVCMCGGRGGDVVGCTSTHPNCVNTHD